MKWFKVGDINLRSPNSLMVKIDTYDNNINISCWQRHQRWMKKEKEGEYSLWLMSCKKAGIGLYKLLFSFSMMKGTLILLGAITVMSSWAVAVNRV